MHEWMWTQFWQVSLVATGALVAGLCLRRRFPHLIHVVLLVVLIKCLTPPIWLHPVSGLVQWQQEPAREEADEPTSQPSSPQSGVQLDIPPATLDRPPVRVPPPVIPPPALKRFEASSPTFTRSAGPPSATPEQPAKPPADQQTASWPVVAVAIAWLIGSVGMALLVAVKWYLNLRAWKRGRVDTIDASLNSQFESLRREWSLPRCRLWVTRETTSPASFGMVRPTVVVPLQMIKDMPAEQRDLILAHELNHLRRRDPLVALLQIAAVCAWWFHPLIWWTSRMLTRVREQCCDQEVVARTDCSPHLYAQSLVTVLKAKPRWQPLAVHLGMQPLEVTRRRLEDIMQITSTAKRQTPRWHWVVFLMLVVLVVPGRAGSNRQSSTPQSLDAPKTKTPTVHHKQDPMESPISVSLAIPMQSDGKRRFYAGGRRHFHQFHVVITNRSDKKLRLWANTCSWGYGNLSLELTLPDGKVVRFAKKPRGWDRNIPVFVELPPGEPWVKIVTLDPEIWDLADASRFAAESTTVSIKAIYEVNPDRESERLSVWTGRTDSQARECTFGYFPGPDSDGAQPGTTFSLESIPGQSLSPKPVTPKRAAGGAVPAGGARVRQH